jgi:hypothetical protein
MVAPMNFWPFRRAKREIAPAEAAQALARHRKRAERALIRARAREMYAKLGRPIPEILR